MKERQERDGDFAHFGAFARLFRHVGECGKGDQQFCACVDQLMVDFWCGIRRVDRGDCAASPCCGVKHHAIFGQVQGHQRDTTTWGIAVFGQSSG